MQVQLVMFRSDGQRREFVLRKAVTYIGRATECDFQIPLAMVSRKHCQINMGEDHVSIRDLGSSNGTFVNDVRVQQGDLEAGDKLVIGPVTFTVVIDGQPANIEPVPSSAKGGADAAFELEEGTVDVEAKEQRTVPRVKAGKRTPPAPAAPVDQLEEIEEVTEVEEARGGLESELEEVTDASPAAEASAGQVPESTEPVAEVEEVQEEEALPQDPLAALQAMTRPKNNPK